MLTTMKPNIHPQVYEDAQVVCSSCGNLFTTASTKKVIHVEVCFRCHPYFTGEHRFIDAKGRVDIFEKKRQVAKVMKENLASKKDRKKEVKEDRPRTLKELLSEI